MRFAIAFIVAVLSSMSGAGGALAAPAPSGSYQQSCKDVYADWNVLTATCRNRWGQWNYTTLSNYRDCDDIENQNGKLVCIREDGNDDDDNDDGWTPRGSYRETCRHKRVEDGTLIAECVDRNGRWRYTELPDFRSCRGDIANVNGMLRCAHGDGDDGDDDDYDLPRGSWRYSCRNARIEGSTLYAQCRDRLGQWRGTFLDLRRCDGDVTNRDGRLVCAGEQGGYGRITLYKHPNYAGKSQTYDADVADLNPYAFGNQASSVVVQGGVWQLCDKPNYRGYCVVIDRSVANLWTYGFNDRAESVRRIR